MSEPSKRFTPTRRLGVGGLVFVIGLQLGCATSSSLSAAEAYDLPKLRDAIKSEVAEGAIDESDAVDIARALAYEDVARAKGPVGLETVRAYGGCARQVDRALDERIEVWDPVAAEAALIRLEYGLDDPGRWVQLADDPDPVNRKVGARALIGENHWTMRRQAFVDPDERVRLSALRAAVEDGVMLDKPVLLDAARRDPMPLARSTATRAVGKLGGEDAVLTLRDIWANADMGDRQAIAGAWASPASIDAGGRRELLWAAETQGGAGSISAALELARAGGAGRSEGIGVLSRAIDEAAYHDRMFAIGSAPWSPAVIDALRRATSDSDERISVAAIARMLSVEKDPSKREAMTSKVRKIEKGKGPGVHRARALLATELRDPGARARLVDDLTSESAQTRRSAASALLGSGRSTDALILVADPDSAVRASIACQILQRAG